jgi:hypothetical protein
MCSDLLRDDGPGANDMVCHLLSMLLPWSVTPESCRCRKVDLHPLPLPVASVQNAYPADSWEGIHACLSQLALFFLLVGGRCPLHTDLSYDTPLW